MKSRIKKSIKANFQQILFVFLSFFTMVLVSYFYVSDIVRSQMLTIGEETMNTTQTAVSASLAETELIFANMTQTTESMLITDKTNPQILDFLIETNNYFRTERTDLPDFMKVYGYIRGEFLDGSGWVPPIDYVPQKRPWYIGAEQSGEKIFFSEPYMDAETGGMCLSFSQQVFDLNGNACGVLAIDLKLSRITDYIAGQQIANNGYGVLISNTLNFTTHHNQALVDSNMADVSTDYAKLAQMLEDKQPIAAERFTDVDGTESIAFFRTIFNGWHIGVIIPRASYYQPVTNLAVMLGILGFILMSALCYILIRTRAEKIRSDEENMSKSDFLARMSHEIRTPMNAVKGLSELLAMTELNSLQRNYVKNIITSANSLLSVINDILDFSKIDANKIEFIDSPYDLCGLITGVCNVVSMRAGEKNLLLLIDASPNLPTTLFGDDARIKQIITNILSNAVKYTNEGYIRLTLRIEERNGATWLFCAVEDSGIGIREENIPTLFDAFSRADLHANRSIAGTGLGLAISKQLTVAMGGYIQVESTYGQGSTFTLHIPQKIVDNRPIAEVLNPETKHILLLGGGGNAQNLLDMFDSLGVSHTSIPAQDVLEADDLLKYTHCIFDESISDRVIRSLYELMPECLFSALKDMRHAMAISDCHDTVIYLPVFISEMARVLNRNKQDAEKTDVSPEGNGEQLILNDTIFLVVDDNDINLIVSGEMLRSFNAEVVCAESGDEAINLCSGQKFDVIFMDHMMPGKDGIETTLEIRQSQNPNKETPIVALTANVINDMKSIYLDGGMDDFISKPIEFSDISRVLCKWLPKEKFSTQENALDADTNTNTESNNSKILSPEDMIAAFDNFGFYSSDVMREMNGDFDGYISRMEAASNVLNNLVTNLNAEVSERRWDDFSKDCFELYSLLYGIGARDCAARARKLAIAGRDHNVDYINEDFFSLMSNTYMLDKKLLVIVPFARGEGSQNLPLDEPHFLHGCLEKMFRALRDSNAAETITQLECAASFSLNREFDMALKAIKTDLEKGDFVSAIEHHAEIFRTYTEYITNL